ncbi:IclR family transcriptional regulator [Companilactobacillus furfuricola]|uniref:IclR family transcriptional regulator n=1 Tax=Companilactobacillus furfuricola TaxID=1462575 RepID=UPI000F79E2B7|nr:IclR family transcriptional regulator C-terminal domain-containing protein [Companilactobacillus furfuricola]
MATSSSTLRNGLKILKLLAQHSGQSLTTISKNLGLNKSTTFRLLETLVEEKQVKKIDHLYSLDHTNSFLKKPISIDPVSISVSRDILKQFNTTAYVGILSSTNVVITQVFPVKNDFSEFSVLGNITPVHLSALGKAIVAFLPKDKQEIILENLHYDIGTKYTLSDHTIFQKNLNVIEEKGYALDDEESSLGVRCLAVPIYRNHQVVASLGLSGSFESLPRTGLVRISKILMRSSQQITNEFF